jgi:hypothetical protein
VNRKIIIIISVLITVGVLVFGVFWFQKQQTIKRELLLWNFIKSNLIEENQPDSLDIKKISDEIDQIFYTAEWTSNNIAFYVSLYYDDNSYPNLILFIPALGNMENMNTTTVPWAVGIFFKTTRENWECEKMDISEICESSWVEEGKTKCIGVRNLLIADKYFFYACEVPFENDNHYNNQGCCMTAAINK